MILYNITCKADIKLHIIKYVTYKPIVNLHTFSKKIPKCLLYVLLKTHSKN